MISPAFFVLVQVQFGLSLGMLFRGRIYVLWRKQQRRKDVDGGGCGGGSSNNDDDDDGEMRSQCVLRVCEYML